MCYVVKRERFAKSSKNQFHTEDILYSKLRPYLNKVVFAEKDGFCSSEILPIKFCKSILPKYAYYYLKTSFFLSYANNSSYGVKMPRLGTGTGRNALFPIPPLTEQQKIIKSVNLLLEEVLLIEENFGKLFQQVVLSKSKLLDLAIRGKLLPQNPNDEPAAVLLERIRKEQESTKTKRKSIGSYIFKGEDNLYYEQIGSETKCIQDEIPFNIPANWVWCRLLEICKVYQPKTISTRQMVAAGEFVVFGANGIIGRYSEYNHKEAEVLITCRGATCGAINVSLPFSWINGNAMVISPLYENIPSKSFLELYLKGINMNEYITGTAQPQITREELSKMKLPIPPLEEQKRIVEYISKANNKLDSMLNE